MTFDQTERRLVVGSRNGAISIWNFNNGACLKILTNGDGLEVSFVTSRCMIEILGQKRNVKPNSSRVVLMVISRGGHNFVNR